MVTVTVGEQKPQSEKPFPKLMICKDEQGSTIVFMLTKNGVGNLVTSTHESWDDRNERPQDCYETKNNWIISKFTDYNEPITLQNA